MSVTIGDNSATYNYTSDGDLSEATFASGMKRSWTYDSNRLLCRSAVNSESGDLLASLDVTNNFDGKATITMFPKNMTNEIVYDTTGAILSSSTESDVKFTEVETVVPGSEMMMKSHMFGDQVYKAILYSNSIVLLRDYC